MVKIPKIIFSIWVKDKKPKAAFTRVGACSAAQQHRSGVIRRVSSRKSAIENLLEALKAERASAENRATSSTATNSPRLPRTPAVPASPSIPRSPRLTGTDLTVTTGGKKLSTIFAFGSNNEKIDNNQI